MDPTSNLASPVLTDTTPMNSTRLGIHSSLLPYSHNGSLSPALLTIPKRKPGILGEVRSSLLDAMKSSSPTHHKLTKESATEKTISDSDLAYRNWKVSLLKLIVFSPNFIRHALILVWICSSSIHLLLIRLTKLQTVSRERKLLCSWIMMVLYHL